MRSATLYVESGTARDCATAAQLLGFDSADAYAEFAIRQQLEFKMPEIAELQKNISAAINAARKAWRDKYPGISKTPAQQAAAAITEAQH